MADVVILRTVDAYEFAQLRDAVKNTDLDPSVTPENDHVEFKPHFRATSCHPPQKTHLL